jgi:hypothetical protein
MLSRFVAWAIRSVLVLGVAVNSSEIGSLVAVANCEFNECDESVQWTFSPYYGFNPSDWEGIQYSAKFAMRGRSENPIGGSPTPHNGGAYIIAANSYWGWVPFCLDYTPGGAFYKTKDQSTQGEAMPEDDSAETFCADAQGYGLEHSWNDYYDKDGHPQP